MTSQGPSNPASSGGCETFFHYFPEITQSSRNFPTKTLVIGLTKSIIVSAIGHPKVTVWRSYWLKINKKNCISSNTHIGLLKKIDGHDNASFRNVVNQIFKQKNCMMQDNRESKPFERDAALFDSLEVILSTILYLKKKNFSRNSYKYSSENPFSSKD